MRIVFLQNKGKSYGGIWQVYNMVGNALIQNGFDVHIVSIRENKTNYIPKYNPKMKVITLNSKDLWETYTWKEILKDLEKLHFVNFFKKLLNRLHNNLTLKKDKKRLKKYLSINNPDYIISSQYQLLDMIPKKYLNKVFQHNHSNFIDAINHKATRKTYLRYKDKIKFIWLSKKTMMEAIKYGFKNSTYIYNPVRFSLNKINDNFENKKLITVARLSKEKRIDLMIDYVQEIFNDEKYKDWSFEIYGSGDELMALKSKINNNQIKLMGLADDTKKVFSSSTINLIASTNEGFCLSIIEGYECGVPVICYDFGEPTNEIVVNNKTGFIAKNRNDYISKLKQLMDNKDLLKEMSINCKEFNNNFNINNIIKEWEKLFR